MLARIERFATGTTREPDKKMLLEFLVRLPESDQAGTQLANCAWAERPFEERCRKSSIPLLPAKTPNAIIGW
jgi:hypothetical protein